MQAKHDYSCYLVFDPQYCELAKLPATLTAVAAAGISCVQLRAKTLSTHAITAIAKTMLATLRRYQIPLIINDNPEIALQVNADGVHLGQQDMAYPDARKLLGADKIIGLSLENYQQAQQSSHLTVDYFGVGPIFATASKSDAAPALGIFELQQIRKLITKPLVAIGGINHANATQVMECGVDGVAVIAAILANEHPGLAAQQLVQIVQRYKKTHAKF